MMISKAFFTTTIFLFFLSNVFAGDARKDIHSFANINKIRNTHLALDLTVDFDKKQLYGHVTLDLVNKSGTDSLVLDIRDLTIEKVTLDNGKETLFYFGKEKKFLGRPLYIKISPETKQVTIFYRTSTNAVALQWLSPEQTAGKKYPFLFTQSQPNLARSWIPCQDSPGNRITYSATIHTAPDLLAVMSAENPTKKNDQGVYTFEMKQPIPTYLLALAVGDLDFRSISDRCGIYAEPSVVDTAAWEFADTEKMIHAAESLYGPYRWGRYDILVLPPSFPYGGMENPRLTFATPTVLAGDRSLVSLIAHELAHSWSGNLVTNATWSDFWLNEGFTTYIENRIMETLYGKDLAVMLQALSYKSIQDEISRLGKDSPDTKLYINLEGRDPDEGAGNLAYDKGSAFLRMLELHFGREKFDNFLKTYFDNYAFQTMTTPEFVAYLDQHLLNNDTNLKKLLHIDEWVYGTGLPENCPVPQSQEFARVKKQLDAWLAGTSPSKIDVMNWTTNHWLYFLGNVPDSVTLEQMATLDKTFHFTQSGNSEILFQWLMLSLKKGYQPAYPVIEKFLLNVGRRKFVAPLYMEMAKTQWNRQWALKIYAKARKGYHPVTYLSVDKILNYQPAVN